MKGSISRKRHAKKGQTMLQTSDYQRATKALEALGYKNYPSLEQIKASFTKEQLAYVKKHKGVLVITPPVTLKDLIGRFDEKQSTKTWVFEELWNQYDVKSQSGRADFVLMDAQNDYDEPHLYFTNQTYEGQLESLTKKQKEIAGLEALNPLTYIMLQTIKREHGKKFIDRLTWTRCIGLGKKTVDGDSWVGYVYSDGGQLALDRSGGYAFPYVGVGLSVGQNLDFKLSPSSEAPSSFELPDVLEINGQRYRREA